MQRNIIIHAQKDAQITRMNRKIRDKQSFINIIKNHGLELPLKHKLINYIQQTYGDKYINAGAMITIEEIAPNRSMIRISSPNNAWYSCSSKEITNILAKSTILTAMVQTILNVNHETAIDKLEKYEWNITKLMKKHYGSKSIIKSKSSQQRSDSNKKVSRSQI